MPAPAEPASTLDAALTLASQGFHVFPVISGGRVPAIGAWQIRATMDPAQIKAWWTELDPVLELERVKDYNVGICTTKFGATGHLLVVDVDVKKGGQGDKTIAGFKLLYEDDWDATLRVDTPSGGFHLYYTVDEPAATTSKRIGKGLDTRATAGYVIAPGSVIGDRSYSLRGGTIKAAPAWLIEAVGKPPERQSNQNVVALLDTQPALDRGARWLKEAAPGAEIGARGSTAYRVAANLKDFGISELAAQELMIEHWNTARCDPPMEFEDLSASVSHAYTYGKEAIGSRNPTADFGPVEAERHGADAVPVGDEHKPSKFKRERFGSIFIDLNIHQLIDDWLDAAGFSIMFGDSNVGKTFVAMDMGFHIAAGLPWFGNKVVRGAVLYVAAEAGNSARKRMMALHKHYGLSDIPMHLIAAPVNLLRFDGDMGDIIKAVREFEAETGLRVVLIVIDTLSRVLAGGDENGPEDMGALVSHLEAIRAATTAHILVIHHSGKDKAKGSRGHTSLRAAIDTEIEIAEGVINATKQRDQEKGQPLRFQLRAITLGARDDGKAVTSAIVEPGAAPADFEALALTPMEKFTMHCLEIAIEADGKTIHDRQCAHRVAWRECFINRYIDQENPVNESVKKGVFTRTEIATIFRQHKAALVKKICIEEIQHDHWVIVEA